MLNRQGKQSFGESLPNKCYEADIRYSLQMCQWVLKSIGMWTPIYGSATISERIISWILMITCFCSLCFILIPSGHYTFFREQEIKAKVMLFGRVGFCIIATIKYCYLGLRATSIRWCIKHVEKDWRMIDDPEHRSIMLKNVTTGRHLTAMCALLLYIGGLSFHTALPLLSRRTIGNVTYRPLMYPGYDIFFDETASPTYEILLSFHCFYAFIAHNITIAACSLAAIFVTHACGQIQIQMHRLQSVVHMYRTQSVQVEDPLTIIVKDHVRILRFLQYVEEVLRLICLMELISSTLIMCLLQYYCITEWSNSDIMAIFTFCVLIVAIAFNMLIFCYIGELLVEQAGKIGEACYAIEWYNLPSKKARPLILLIMMAKYPPKLTAGKMFELSLATFSTVLRSSVAYLNLIRTVAE